MTTDQMQNEVILIGHHAEDVEKAIAKMPEPDKSVALAGLNDIKEGVKRLVSMLPKEMQSEVTRLTPDQIASEMD